MEGRLFTQMEGSSGGHDVGGSRENVLVESGDILRCL